MKQKQQGTVLFISMIILLVLTMVGLNSMQNSTLEGKMALNERNQKIVFQDAESSLSEAERNFAVKDWNTELSALFATKQAGYHSQDSAKVDYFNKANWAPNVSCIALPTAPNGGNSCYIAEEISKDAIFIPLEYDQTPPDDRKLNARITVRSTDTNDASMVIVQSSIQKLITP